MPRVIERVKNSIKDIENNLDIFNDSSVDNALVVKAISDSDGVRMEYEYLKRKFGKINKNWGLLAQSIFERDGKWYDELLIVFPDNKVKRVVFNITSFFNLSMRKKKKLEHIRKRRRMFKPRKVKVLFIGESPPNSGNFFYNCNSRLYESTKKVFEKFWGKFKYDEDFLKKFKRHGFYLEDLCDHPINHLNGKHRRIERRKNVKKLAKKLNELKPRYVIIVMKGIESCVVEAIKKSGIKVKWKSLPFPARGYQKEYENYLEKILKNEIDL